MATLNDTVQYITVEDFKNGFADGTWKFCRKDYYIRQGVDNQSVDEKKQALVLNIRDENNNKVGDIKVLEPLAINQYVDENGKTINEVISGNTRGRSILELLGTKPAAVTFGNNAKESMVVIIKKFEPIPYRTFNAPITLQEAIEFQTSTNDFTKKHNPFDVALKIVELKPVLKQQFIDSGVGDKDAGGRATDALCQLFRRTRANVSQSTSVIEDATDLVKNLIRDERMSFDTASTLLQNIKKFEGIKKSDSVPAENINKIVNELLQQSKVSAASSQNIAVDKVDDSTVRIFKSQVNSYFANLTAKGSQDAIAGENGEKITPPVTAVANGSNPPASAEDKPLKAVSKEDFVEDIRKLNSAIYVIEPELVTAKHATNINELNVAMLQIVEETNNLFPTETAIDLYNDIYQLYNKRMAKIEELANAIGASEKAEYAQYRKKFAKMSKPLENIMKEFNNAAKPVAEVNPIAESEVIEMVETDTHEYAVTA